MSDSFLVRSDNPLPLLFVSRLLVLYLIWIRGMKHIFPPFLPFFSGLDYMREILWIYPILDLIYWISVFAILFGIRFQLFALVLSSLIFFQILSSKGFYATSYQYAGCMLFLIGIFQSGQQWIFRVQIGILYFGAGLNKLLNEDWQSGQYFENFILNVYPNFLSLSLAKWLGIGFLAKFLSYLTIFLELSLAAWAISGKRKLLFVFSIISFHLSMMIFTFGKLSFIYFFLMSSTSYLLLPWPKKGEIQIYSDPNSHFSYLLKRLDFDNFFIWNAGANKKNHIIVNPSMFISLKNQSLLIFHKAVFFVIVSGVVFLVMYKTKIVSFFYGI